MPTRVMAAKRRSTAQNAVCRCHRHLQNNSTCFSQTLVREQIPDTLHLHGYLWRRDRNETDIRNKWGKYSKRGRHPVRLRKAAEGQHHPLSPSLYSSNYP